jgi:hypothetical protein
VNENQYSYSWEKQKQSDTCETAECPEHDGYKDFKRDPSGYYVLIKVNFSLVRIEVGVCDKDHNVVRIFRGRKSQDIYSAIFNFEKDHKVLWFQEKTHIAYLGKELKKAELALVMGNSAYFQE